MIKVFKAKNIKEVENFEKEKIYYGLISVSGRKVRMFDYNLNEVVMTSPQHSCLRWRDYGEEKHFETYFEEEESIPKENKRVAIEFIKEMSKCQ